METNVYTDGACSNNGQRGAKAGLGVYFGTDDPRNCAQRIEGKQTNNTAEYARLQYVTIECSWGHSGEQDGMRTPHKKGMRTRQRAKIQIDTSRSNPQSRPSHSLQIWST